MSIYTNFHRFVLGSDFVAGGDGSSSDVFSAGSDMGTLLMALSSDRVYHVTQFTMHLHSLSDNIHAHVCSLDSDGANETCLTIAYGLANAAAKGGQGTFTWTNDPPIRVQYSSDAHYISAHIHVNDSDVEAGLSYNGFYTPAA